MTEENTKKLKPTTLIDTMELTNQDETDSFFLNPLPPKDQQTLYQTIHKHLNFQTGTFPGTHNVTFMRKHFTNLLEEDYLCAEKSDGKRILLLIINLNLLTTNKLNPDKANKLNPNETKNIKIFWIDRTNNIFIQNDLKLTNKIINPPFRDEYFFFDCELIKTYDNEIRLYIFDTLIFANKSVCKENLLKRMECARLFLKYYNIEYKNNELKGENFFKIYLKEMYKSYGFAEIYHNVQKLNHKNDGLCFTPVKGPYSIGIDLNWLKWKPAHLNTIDFIVIRMNPLIDLTFTNPENFSNPLFIIDKEIINKDLNNKDIGDIPVYGLFVSKTDNSPIFFDYYIPYYDITSKELKNLENNSICEFQFNKNIYVYSITEDCFIKGGWTLHKIRKDKTKPNTVKIAKNIMIAINERIDIKDLELKFLEMRNNWKNRNP